MSGITPKCRGKKLSLKNINGQLKTTLKGQRTVVHIKVQKTLTENYKHSERLST